LGVVDKARMEKIAMISQDVIQLLEASASRFQQTSGIFIFPAVHGTDGIGTVAYPVSGQLK
jgi:hypothetical protein